MKVLSLVPSWTETLILAGVNVIGRTRYCIHPHQYVKDIPVVGGTKRLNLEKIKELEPDIIILDKEENTLQMAQELTEVGLPWLATHVRSLESCTDGLLLLGETLNNPFLKKWGETYRENFTAKLSEAVIHGDVDKMEGLPCYVIWRNPFMGVSQDTFIGSVFKELGIKLLSQDKKYFEISEELLKKNFCLFSSEPYPFAKEFEILTNEGFKGVVVDGEKLSWFGIRNLRFLKQDPEYL